MFRNIVWISAVFVGVLMFTQDAKAMNFSLVGLMDIANQNNTPSSVVESGVTFGVGNSSGTGLGGGGLVGFDLPSVFEIESGVLYLTRNYQQIATAVGKTETFKYSQHAVELPLLLRCHLLPFLSVGAGGYAAIGVGNVNVNDDGGITGKPQTLSGTYSSQGLLNKDYGLLFSVAVDYPLTATTSVFVDGRYQFALTDVDATPGNTTPPVVQKYTDILLLAGLKFGI